MRYGANEVNSIRLLLQISPHFGCVNRRSSPIRFSCRDSVMPLIYHPRPHADSSRVVIQCTSLRTSDAYFIRGAMSQARLLTGATDGIGLRRQRRLGRIRRRLSRPADLSTLTAGLGDAVAGKHAKLNVLINNAWSLQDIGSHQCDRPQQMRSRCGGMTVWRMWASAPVRSDWNWRIPDVFRGQGKSLLTSLLPWSPILSCVAFVW